MKIFLCVTALISLAVFLGCKLSRFEETCTSGGCCCADNCNGACNADCRCCKGECGCAKCTCNCCK